MKPQPDLFSNADVETIEGTLERVRFASDQDDWSVVALTLSDTGREVTAVGNLAGVQPGENLRLSGRWTPHPKFGAQFKVESFSAVPPATAAGIEHFLSSGLIEGIGKELASRLVARFGARTLEVIEKEPKKLREVEGVGPQRAQRLVDAWGRRRELREIVYLLQSCGVSTGLATRVLRQYGSGAHEVVRRNPWRLAAEIPGVGFRTADAMAKSLGVPPDSPQRIDAGVLHALEERAEEGDVMVARNRLVKESTAILSVGAPVCETALGELSRRRVIIAEQSEEAGSLIGLPRLVFAEENASRRLAAIVKEGRAGAAGPQDAEGRINAFQKEGRHDPFPAAERGGAARRPRQGARHHGRSRHRQDDPGEGNHPDHGRGQGPRFAVRPHGPGGQAHVGGNGQGGQDHPQAPGIQSPEGRLPPKPREPTRVRRAGRG